MLLAKGFLGFQGLHDYLEIAWEALLEQGEGDGDDAREVDVLEVHMLYYFIVEIEQEDHSESTIRPSLVA